VRLYNAAHAAGERGDVDTAIALLVQSSQLHAFPDTLYNLAHWRRVRGDRPQAVALLRDAVDLAAAVGNTRILLLSLNNLAALVRESPTSEAQLEALALLQRADAADGDATDVSVVHNIGLCLLSLRRLDEAYAALQRAVDADPRFVPALLELGNIRFLQDLRTEAVLMYRFEPCALACQHALRTVSIVLVAAVQASGGRGGGR
jgi:tetratricopeptide (TPR) repeat protein